MFDAPATTHSCSCARHPGGAVFDRVSDFVGAHQGLDPGALRDSDVTIRVRRDEPYNPTLVFTGTMDEDGPLQVLCTVYPPEGIAELAFRRHLWETWSAPTELEVTRWG